MRYLYICLFMAVLPVPVILLEFAFQSSGSGLSVHDTRGVGQVSLYLVILLMILAYSRYVARDDNYAFFRLYLMQPMRMAAGFAAAAVFAVSIVVAGYLSFAAIGQIGISDEAVAAFDLDVAERTFVALIVVVILALSEELIFRVFLMRYLRWNTSVPVTVAAVIFASLVFAAAHNVFDPLAWFQPDDRRLFIGLFLLGVLLCTAYLSTGSIACAIGIHFGLLGHKVFLRKTGLLEVHSDHWWLGNDADLRMAPVAWALFSAMAVAILLCRHGLYRRFAIERPVVSGGERANG